MSLFEFKDQNEAGQYGAQSLEVTKKRHVNVVSDYAWTVQPKSARVDVPYLYMVERKLTNDVMIQQLMYNLAAGAEVGHQTATEFFAKLKEKVVPDDQTSNVSDTTVEKTAEGKSRVRELLDSENPYAGLYSLEDTGWSYVLPYFDPSNHNIGGSWGEPDSGGLVSSIMNTATGAIGDIATDVNKIVSALGAGFGETSNTRPGTYIERAKQYKFDAKGPSYSIAFNLYNTGLPSDVIDNWELCFALMYNLLPNRKTKTIFDPPPLYEIEIPGVRRSPVSCIKGMQVDFLGSTRLMDLQVAGQPSLRTIVPDAYSIKIDIEDILPESKNFMQSMVDSTKKVRVTTSSSSENTSRDVQQTFSTHNNITKITL